MKKIWKRKLNEAASSIYRSLFFPFIRLSYEIKTDSILKQGSYVRGACLEGKNFLGKNTAFVNGKLGKGSYINRDGDFTDTEIGRYTSIGAAVSTVVGRHPIKDQVAMHPAFTDPAETFGFSFAKEKTFTGKVGSIKIGNDVWIGNHVKIMDGVTIGDGAVVGAGAVVVKDLPPYSISAGVPAKVIRYRFDEETVKKLEELQWWGNSDEWIRDHIDEFKDIKAFLEEMGRS